MKFIKPNNYNELLEILENKDENRFFLAGGTDLNIQIKNGIIKDPSIVMINHLEELKGICLTEDNIKIGSNVTFFEIINSDLITKYLPFFQKSLKRFASPLLQTTASIGGNIGNGSPTADSIPLLLALDAKLVLVGKNKERVVELKNYFTGYKKNILQKDEIIKEILVSKNSEKDFDGFYKKISSRKSLTIAKATVVCYKKLKNEKIIDLKISVGSLNEYPRRLKNLEEYLLGLEKSKISNEKIREILLKSITPISDLRSDDKYRFEVTFNTIKKFLI